jgi:hypothetical protein
MLAHHYLSALELARAASQDTTALAAPVPSGAGKGRRSYLHPWRLATSAVLICTIWVLLW